MKAVCWYGKQDVRVEEVPDPRIINPRDAIVEVTTAAICGSDLHIYNGWAPGAVRGDILGHEFMGRVVEVGDEVQSLRPGDRVVVPFTISCGRCYYCERELWSLCDNTNPNAWMAETAFGYTPSGMYGYTQLTGGYAGGQAEYVRVPQADHGPLKLPEHLSDEQVLFLSDNLPTGWMAAENCRIEPGDTVAVWGCGPVGLFTIISAYLLGAERVIAIDRFPERLRLAAEVAKAEVINYEDTGVVPRLKELTGGRGPDACVDAVGMEAYGKTLDYAYDRVMQALRFESGRPHALREAIMACRKGGTVSIPGVYVGLVDKIPLGAAFNKGLTLTMGQTHTQRYMAPLLERIERGEIDPTFVISHRFILDEAPLAYELYRTKEDECTKVLLRPNGSG